MEAEWKKMQLNGHGYNIMWDGGFNFKRKKREKKITTNLKRLVFV